ncbi:hypothetical protein EZS27_016261 [termite gut metagenome]|uniref:DUF3575 domain-containing protein n=1 Tax=termite gut metagenome TaxID=433724 RepID=A0A5J4RPF5_9ZZZZ
MKKLLTLAILSLLSVKLLGALPVNTAYRDSIYRHIIKDGFSQLNCYLSYPQGNSQVLKAYDNNGYELNRLDEFIRFVLTEPSVYINKIFITGYCSIEGTYAYNQQLSKDRVTGFVNFVNREYNLSARYPVEVKWEGEDWNMLRRLVAGSIIPERYEMIQIIDEVRNPDEREMRLRILNGGRPYKQIFDELYPLLRRVNIKVEYDVRQVLKDHPTNGELGEAIDSVLQQKDKQPFTKPSKVKRESSRDGKWWYPVSLRTNLISWLGFTPDLKHRSFTPNLAAEFYLKDRWSVIASITYSYLNFNKDKQFWGVSGYSIEPRYQLNTSFRNDDSQKLYIGGYIQYGDFDYCLDKKGTRRTDNYTGIYAQAGLSAGYHFQITPIWGIELGLRGGYQYSNTKIYELEEQPPYLKNKQEKNKIKIDGLNLNVTYKFK